MKTRSQNRSMKTRSQNRSKDHLNLSLSKIIKSAQHRKTKVVKINEILKNGANINYQDANGNTLLHLASNSNEADLLFWSGANAKIKNLVGETALLHLLKKTRNMPTHVRIKTFKSTKAIIKTHYRHFKKNVANVKDKRGNTPIFEYISRNECDLKIIKLLVNLGAILTDTLETNGNSLLHVAVSNPFCKRDVVKYLIEQGLNPNARNYHGQIPLHYAVKTKNCKWDIVEELIRHGANSALCRDKNYYTPLLEAISNAHCSKKVLKVLLNGLEPSIINEEVTYFAETCYLHAAMKHRNIDVIETLITFGADVNITTKCLGFTPLHLAANAPYCDEKVVSILIKYGADVNAKDKYYRTPLHLAFDKTANMNVIKTLLLKGAKMCVLDSCGKTPFHNVLRNRNITGEFLVELLSSEKSIERGLRLTRNQRNFFDYCYTSHAIPISKIVLKYFVLKYHANISEGRIPSVLQVYLSKKHMDSFYEFYHACFSEITLMRIDKVWKNLSFYDIMINEFSELTLNLNNEVKKRMIDAVLVRMTSDQYPIYKDMIMYVRKQDFLKNLDDVRVSTFVCKDGVTRNITLDQFAVRQIAKYLSKQDVINLILVYSNNADSFETEDANFDLTCEVSANAALGCKDKVNDNSVLPMDQ